MDINFVWKENYSVDDDLLDAQHREIIENTNELYWAIAEQKERKVLNSLFDRMETSVSEHFRHEEEIMLDSGYSGLADHKAHHDYFRRLMAELRKHTHRTFGYYLLCYCIEWWIVHILSQDKKYSPFLRPTVFACELS
jgi:hemerythrin